MPASSVTGIGQGSVDNIILVNRDEKTTYVDLNDEGNEDIATFTPDARRAYIVINGVLDSDFILNADNSKSRLGDELFIFIRTSTEIDVTVPAEQFFITSCGGDHEDEISVGPERGILNFIFDGEKFVNTFDNC